MSKKWILFYCLSLFHLGALPLCAQPLETMLKQGGEFYDQNNYAHAHEKYLHALKLAEEENNPESITKASFAIAHCHYHLRDRLTALKWLYRTLSIADKYHLDSIQTAAHYFTSVIYIETGKIDSAEKYSNKAIKVWKAKKDYASLSRALLALTDLYLNTTKDEQKAESTIKIAEKYARLSNNKNAMAFAAMKRYFLHSLLRKNYKTALPYINKAEKLYLETGDREGIGYAYSFKAECLSKLGDTTASDYFWKWFAFKDSIFQQEKTAHLAKYETLYETEKKERENKLLQQENELNRLVLVIVGVVFLLLVVLGLWLYNRYNFKKKQQEFLMMQSLQNDKERIARDLHDNVGGQLSYIIYSLEGINDEDEKKRIEVTNSINQSVRSVINNLRETIWAISDANINVQDFSDKLKVYARTLFDHSNTRINFTEGIKTERELNALLGLNLYRICQEILTNAFKYSNATVVKINLVCEEGKLHISISDNGIGFDITQKNKEQYGLQNIKKRAAEFGISLSLETEINKGTNYTLRV
ncbi:MAG: hypothetical protein K1X81_00025 [Bacteroidia bacterium]|nr:hypothetical protein [Bacteroidia bacterium]